MDNDVVHPETGELLNPSEVAARTELRGRSLHEAIHKTIEALPVWIKQDESAQVTDKVKRKYATLKAIMTDVRPVALRNGIRIRQGCDHAWALDTGQTKGRMVPVFTELVHTATGETERTTVEIPLTRMDAQAMGSAISYGRRYGILAAFGLTTDEADDDGRATQGRGAISDSHEETQELWIIKEEIKGCETLKALTDWGKKADENGRVGKLSESESAVAHAFYSDRLRALRYSHDTEVKGKK